MKNNRRDYHFETDIAILQIFLGIPAAALISFPAAYFTIVYLGLLYYFIATPYRFGLEIRYWNGKELTKRKSDQAQKVYCCFDDRGSYRERSTVLQSILHLPIDADGPSAKYDPAFKCLIEHELRHASYKDFLITKGFIVITITLVVIVFVWLRNLLLEEKYQFDPTYPFSTALIVISALLPFAMVVRTALFFRRREIRVDRECHQQIGDEYIVFLKLQSSLEESLKHSISTSKPISSIARTIRALWHPTFQRRLRMIGTNTHDLRDILLESSFWGMLHFFIFMPTFWSFFYLTNILEFIDVYGFDNIDMKGSDLNLSILAGLICGISLSVLSRYAAFLIKFRATPIRLLFMLFMTIIGVMIFSCVVFFTALFQGENLANALVYSVDQYRYLLLILVAIFTAFILAWLSNFLTMLTDSRISIISLLSSYVVYLISIAQRAGSIF